MIFTFQIIKFFNQCPLILWVLPFFYFQPSRFKLDLSTNSNESTAVHKVRLRKLSADVDDYSIYKYFSEKYDSVQSAIGDC
jgi:hypothetical protein